MRFDRADDVLMTLAAGPFSDLPAPGSNVDIVREPAGREVIRMPKSVACFGRVLTNKLGRSMAIVADGHRSMARLDPTGILLIHDVTIHARVRIVCHVGVASSVHERVCAYPEGETNDHT